MVVQSLDGEQIDHAAMNAGLRVAGTVDHPGDARVKNGPGAHCAGLQCHEKFATREPVVPEIARGIAQRGNFRVGCGVTFANRAVEATADDFTVEREADGFRVRGRLVERAAVMTDMENDEAVAFLRRTLTKMGVTTALQEKGIKRGDVVRLGKVEMLWWKEENPNIGP